MRHYAAWRKEIARDEQAERRRVEGVAADRRFCLPADQMDREADRRATLAMALNAEESDD